MKRRESLDTPPNNKKVYLTKNDFLCGRESLFTGKLIEGFLHKEPFLPQLQLYNRHAIAGMW
jgi:hypothetical protein